MRFKPVLVLLLSFLFVMGAASALPAAEIYPPAAGTLTLTKQLIIFGDEDRISPVYAAAVQDAVKLGLLEHDNKFRPKDTLDRGEYQAFLKAFRNVVNSGQNPDGVTYSLSGDRRTITLYWGEKPTGGYAVHIRSIMPEGGTLKVFYSLRSPGPGEVVTQALTYPWATAELPADTGAFDEVLLVRWTDPQKVIFYIGKKTFRVDGRTLSMDAAPFLENGRAFVPVRFLALALGVPEEKIIWSPSDRAVTLMKDGVTLSLAPGGNIMNVNDRSVRMDVMPQLREGRVYLPARFIAEAFGHGVEWDAVEQSVAIGPDSREPGDTAFSRMSAGTYPGDSPLELFSPGSLQAGQRVTVRGKRLPWALVRSGSIEGWIPLWYLTGEGHNLPEITPYPMVVKKRAPVHLYPDKDAPLTRDLDAGKVVKVEYEYGPWRYVHIVVYDIPAVLRGWVPGEYLAAAGEVAPTEGRIPKGTRVYYGDPDAADTSGMSGEITPCQMIVGVLHEKGEMLYVNAAGGWSAWVRKQDVVFNPFDM